MGLDLQGVLSLFPDFGHFCTSGCPRLRPGGGVIVSQVTCPSEQRMTMVNPQFSFPIMVQQGQATAA